MTPRASPPGIEDMPAALLSFVAGKPGGQVARQNAVVAVEQALEARRIESAHQGGHIPGAVGGGVRPQYPWPANDHDGAHRPARDGRRRPVRPLHAPAACLVPLIVDDRPCAAGGITPEPGRCGRSAPASLHGKPPLDAGTLERVECRMRRTSALVLLYIC